MGIRVRVRIVAGGSSVETAALINSGFESDRPDVCVPVALARRLGLWPPPGAVESEEAVTAGGEVTYTWSAGRRGCSWSLAAR